MSTNSEEYLKALGQKIANIRSEKQMTQYKLAKILFMEQANLTRIEQGKTNPTIKTLLKISDALEINIEELFK